MFFDRRKRDNENAGADTKTDLQKTQNFCPGFSEIGQRDIDNFIRVKNKSATSLKKLRLTGE